MATGQSMQFSGTTIDKYDAVKQELGWDGETGKPEGLIAHAVGATDDGFCVIEWWDSTDDWNTFFSQRLMAAFEKVGDIPPPNVTQFDVHASFIAA
jgi:hypothetical protein